MTTAEKKRESGYVKCHDILDIYAYYPDGIKVYTEQWHDFDEDGEGGVWSSSEEFRLVFKTPIAKIAVNFSSHNCESLATSMIKYKDERNFPEASEESPEVYESNVFWLTGKVSLTPTWFNNHEEYCLGGLRIRLQTDDADWADIELNLGELLIQPDEFINEIGVKLMKTLS